MYGCDSWTIKKAWVLKNWCFWTVVLEKTLENPLDCKEIQPVHAKGNQSWIFIGRTDVEAETPILWHLMRRMDSLEKTLMLGKIEGGRRRGRQRMRWLDGITNSWSLLKLMSIGSVMPSNHLIFYRPLLLPPSVFRSIRIFSNESPLRISWPKYWSFSLSINPSKQYSELISFSMDWLDLLTVQGTSKSLLQHHSSKPSILLCSAFFIVQLTSIHDSWKNHSFD